ncbi:MAG: ASCH domain-containing protein [Clostridia bacterium]|nr:ASCH domain-containing protein [Clostridia bacterium]
MTHEMNLHDGPYDMIASGRKKYELRLYDEKRRDIKIGDEILFTRSRGGEDSMRVRVLGLHLFDSFTELYAAIPLLECGYTEEDVADASPSDMDIYYSKERQSMFGVVAIEIELV